MMKGPTSFFYMWIASWPRTICLKKLFFPHWTDLVFLSKIGYWKREDLFPDSKFYSINLYVYPFASTKVSLGSVQISSVTQSCPTLCDSMNRSTPGHPVHHQLPQVHPNPCPSSLWRHPTISSSVIPFSSCPQSFPW